MVLNLNRELIARGQRSTVISAGGSLSTQVQTDGGEHITLDVCSKNPLRFPQRVRALRTTLAGLQPDLLHVHSRVPAWLTWFANKRLGLPFITTVHGFNSVSKYSEIMTKGDAVICVSHPVKEYIQNHYSVDKNKLRVIHCGISMEEFSPDQVDEQIMENLKTKLGTQGKQVISAIGRITELKDYETFIQAVAIATQTNPDILGLIVGNVRHDKQAYYARLQQLVSDLKMEEHIRFITGGAPMRELYALSSVVVSCSKKPESFGLTLIEALAMNTPIIATRHGGPIDIILEGKNGHFFEKGDAEALACLWITAKPTMADLRTDAIQRFSLNKMVDSTMAVYLASAHHD